MIGLNVLECAWASAMLIACDVRTVVVWCGCTVSHLGLLARQSADAGAWGLRELMQYWRCACM